MQRIVNAFKKIREKKMKLPQITHILVRMPSGGRGGGRGGNQIEHIGPMQICINWKNKNKNVENKANIYKYIYKNQ